RLMGVINLDTPEGSREWTAFMAVIQMGTLLAAVGYFRPEIIHIVGGLAGTSPAVLFKAGTSGSNENWGRLGWLLITASVPICIVGFVFRNQIESNLTKRPLVIFWALLGVAALLAIGEATGNKARGILGLSVAEAMAIGSAQVFALVPGASRSGLTIATGLLCGLNREAAARFSFLLMMPAVAASGLFKLPGAIRSMNAGMTQVVAAALAAGVAGYLTIGAMLGYLQNHTVYGFVIYRLVVGGVVLGLLGSGRRKPDGGS